MANYPALGDPVDWTALAAAATSAFSASLGALGGQLVQSVRVDSAYLPPLQLVGEDGSGAIGGSSGWNLGPILKPKLTIQLSAGQPIIYAPYGDPGQASWLPLIVASALVIGISYRMGKKSRGR